MKKIPKLPLIIISVVLICIVAFFFIRGKSNKNNIVGTWNPIHKYRDEPMMFYEDGTWLDTPLDEHSNHAEKYKLQEDGMLFFYTSYGDTITLSPAKNEEEAMDSYDTYYLSGNTFILHTIRFEKK